MAYDLELLMVIDAIRKQKARKVLIQLPDGLKQGAKEIADRIEKDTGAEAIIWQGSCFGACDTPNVEGIDLLVQFGHSEWT